MHWENQKSFSATHNSLSHIQLKRKTEQKISPSNTQTTPHPQPKIVLGPGRAEVWRGISYWDLQKRQNPSRSVLGCAQDIIQICLYTCYNLSICFQDGVGLCRSPMCPEQAGWAGLRPELCAHCASQRPWRSLGRAQIPLMWVLGGHPVQGRCGQSQPLVWSPDCLTQVLPVFKWDYLVQGRGGHWAWFTNSPWRTNVPPELRLNCAFWSGLCWHKANSTQIPTSAIGVDNYDFL